MMMLLVITIFLVFIILGYKRGLFRSILKLVLTGLSFILAYLLAPIVSGILIQHTNLDEYIHDKIYTAIVSRVEQHIETELTETLGYADENLVQQMTNVFMATELNRNEQVAFIQESGFPGYVQDALLSNNNDETKEKLGVNGFYDYIATYVSYMIINGFSFLLAALVLRIIFGLVSLILSLAVQLPIIGSINRFGGIVFGAAEGLIVVWLLFLIVSVFASTKYGQAIYNQIMENRFLSLLYEKDVFRTVIAELNIDKIF